MEEFSSSVYQHLSLNKS